MALLAATEGRFFKVVNDTISSSPSCVTPTRRHALAPSVAGTTLGLVGYGAVGRRLATLGAAGDWTALTQLQTQLKAGK